MVKRVGNKKYSQKGFTIVELLIVIVIIGILAALVIVAYTGIQNRAKTVDAKTAAGVVRKKVEAYKVVNDYNGEYPDHTYVLNPGTPGAPEASLQGTGITLGEPISTNPKRIGYYICTGGGYRITWWDYTAGAPSTPTDSIELDGATDSSTCSTLVPYFP